MICNGARRTQRSIFGPISTLARPCYLPYFLPTLVSRGSNWTMIVRIDRQNTLVCLIGLFFLFARTFPSRGIASDD